LLVGVISLPGDVYLIAAIIAAISLGAVAFAAVREPRNLFLRLTIRAVFNQRNDFIVVGKTICPYQVTLG